MHGKHCKLEASAATIRLCLRAVNTTVHTKYVPFENVTQDGPPNRIRQQPRGPCWGLRGWMLAIVSHNHVWYIIPCKSCCAGVL